MSSVSDPAHVRSDVGVAGDARERCELHAARQVRRAQPGGAQRVRRDRRVEGRHHRRPAGCRFDPATLQCKAATAAAAGAAGCLTPPQVEAARKIYLGQQLTHGRGVYSPFIRAANRDGVQLAGGAEPLGIPVEFFKYYVLRDPNWDYKTRPINYDGDVALPIVPRFSRSTLSIRICESSSPVAASCS